MGQNKSMRGGGGSGERGGGFVLGGALSEGSSGVQSFLYCIVLVAVVGEQSANWDSNKPLSKTHGRKMTGVNVDNELCFFFWLLKNRSFKNSFLQSNPSRSKKTIWDGSHYLTTVL